jgi:hypothetical protein
MKLTYQMLDIANSGKVLKKIEENGQEWFIPLDESNSDYQAYLESLTKVKTPKVVDEAAPL